MCEASHRRGETLAVVSPFQLDEVAVKALVLVHQDGCALHLDGGWRVFIVLAIVVPELDVEGFKFAQAGQLLMPLLWACSYKGARQRCRLVNCAHCLHLQVLPVEERSHSDGGGR